MNNKDFILNTLLPYKQNPTTCAISNQNSCEYLTKDGRKCAVGKHMRPGKWQQFTQGITNLAKYRELKEFLTEEAFNQNIKLTVWTEMQSYHDSIALNMDQKFINKIVDKIEQLTKLEFNELRY